MDLQAWQQHKDTILEAWRNAVYKLYPFETKGFLRTQKDMFANPVGHATIRATAILLDAILGEDVVDLEVQDALQAFMRVRSVQDLRVEQIAGVLLLLKPLTRQYLLPEALKADKLDAYLSLESRIDTLSLMALSLCEAQKAALVQLRVDEVKRTNGNVLRWAVRRGFVADSTSLE